MEQANYILVLKRALKDVLTQNDQLTGKVSELSKVVREQETAIEARERAIQELYQVLDQQMNGALSERVFEEVDHEFTTEWGIVQ